MASRPLLAPLPAVRHEKPLGGQWIVHRSRRRWRNWSEPSLRTVAIRVVTMAADFLLQPDKWFCEGVSAHDAVPSRICVIRMCHCVDLLLLEKTPVACFGNTRKNSISARDDFRGS